MKLPPHVSEEEEPLGVSEEEPPGRHVRGGVPRRRGGGAVRQTTHISTKSSDEASSWHEGGAVWQRLELPTSCIREVGGAVRQQLELPTSWCEGGGAVTLEGEANLS
jgi:hypothetical protein